MRTRLSRPRRRRSQRGSMARVGARLLLSRVNPSRGTERPYLSPGWLLATSPLAAVRFPSSAQIPSPPGTLRRATGPANLRPQIRFAPESAVNRRGGGRALPASGREGRAWPPLPMTTESMTLAHLEASHVALGDGVGASGDRRGVSRCSWRRRGGWPDAESHGCEGGASSRSLAER